MSRLYQTSSAMKYHKKYRKPQLQELGDLRTLTMGGSPGTGDSSGSTSRFPSNKTLRQPFDFPPLPDGSRIGPDGSILPPNETPNT